MELEQELNIVCEQLDESGGASALLVIYHFFLSPF